jgi:hypothetical protein
MTMRKKKKRRSTHEVRTSRTPSPTTILTTLSLSSFLAADDFLATGGEGEEDEDLNRRAAQHTILDRKERELDDQDLARIAQDLNKRYGRAAVRYTGDMNEVPQRLLMPSVHDPSLWQVRVKVRRTPERCVSISDEASESPVASATSCSV